MAMQTIVLIIAAGVICALLTAIVIGVAWALSSNRRPPST
jgi:hypothetical protein